MPKNILKINLNNIWWFQLINISLHSKTNKMKQTKEQVIENLNNISYNVLFTKEDLIIIVESIEESNHTTFPFDSYLDVITERVVSTLQDMGTDELISDFEVELNNKEVYVESIDFNERNVTKNIKTELRKYFNELKKDQVKE